MINQLADSTIPHLQQNKSNAETLHKYQWLRDLYQKEAYTAGKNYNTEVDQKLTEFFKDTVSKIQLLITAIFFTSNPIMDMFSPHIAAHTCRYWLHKQSIDRSAFKREFMMLTMARGHDTN